MKEETVIKTGFEELMATLVAGYDLLMEEYRAAEAIDGWLSNESIVTLHVKSNWDKNDTNRFASNTAEWLEKDYLQNDDILYDLMQLLCIKGKIEPGTYLIE